MDIKNEILVRIYIVAALIVLLALVILFQSVKISIIERDKWKEKAKEYQLKDVTAARGNIMAEDGSLLATSLPFYDIYFDSQVPPLTDAIFNKHLDSLAYLLATRVDNSYTPGGYKERLKTARIKGIRYLPIKKGVSHLELEEIKTFPIFNKGKYRGGLIVEKKPKRKRPFGILAYRTVGYVRDSIQVGLEGYFNKELGGKVGKRSMKKVKGLDGSSIWIPADDYTRVNPVEGNDIKTTLDINIQDITEQALMRGIQKNNAKYGTAVVLEVKTGAIKAIANIEKGENGFWETYNYAIGRRIEPGSTFKLASVMALLEDKAHDLDDTIKVFKGKHTFFDTEMVDASYHPWEEATLRRVFEVSSNVGIAYNVNQYYEKDKSKFVNHLKDFNLDLPTGIEIQGERPPLIKDPKNKEDKWSGLTLPWMSIGYEVELTPLQIANFYNTVANNGKMMKPYLVKEIIKNGKVIQSFKPTIVDSKIASSSTIQAAKELLEGVVLNGTAKNLKTNAYELAGKTGTSQIGYSKKNATKKYQASFAGYFPADKPIYTCYILVNEPRNGSYYGSDVAGPIFREIADKIYTSKLDLQTPINTTSKPAWKTYALPSMDVGNREEMSYLLTSLNIPYSDSTNGNWTLTQAKADTLSLKRRNIKPDFVPNVLGMGLRDAIFILENNGLKVTLSGIGKVRKQSIPPGRKIKGQTIHLTLN